MDGNFITQFAGLIAVIVLIIVGVLTFFVPLMIFSISCTLKRIETAQNETNRLLRKFQ